MRTIPKGPVDTRKKLRTIMDDLNLKLGEELLKLNPKTHLNEILTGTATITKYLATVNKEPEQPEGADLGEYRERLNRLSVVRGGGGGEPDGDGDTDDSGGDGTDDPAEDDAAGGPDDSSATDPEPRAA